MTATTNDTRDVKRAQGGDEAALTALLTRYAPLVKARARHYALSIDDVDDLIQEGLLALVIAVRRFDETRGAFAAFASHVVTHRLIDVVRRRHRDSVPFEPLTLSDPEEKTRWDSDLASLEACRDFLHTTLSGYERRVVTLYMQGFTYRDIAARLATSPKSVDNAMVRVRRKLSAET